MPDKKQLKNDQWYETGSDGLKTRVQDLCGLGVCDAPDLWGHHYWPSAFMQGVCQIKGQLIFQVYATFGPVFSNKPPSVMSIEMMRVKNLKTRSDYPSVSRPVWCNGVIKLRQVLRLDDDVLRQVLRLQKYKI